MKKKLKKIIPFLACVSLLGSNLVFANEFWYTHWPENIWDPRWQTNFLFGFFAGYGHREGGLDLTIRYGGLPLIPQSTVVRDVTDKGAIYGGILGYQGKCYQWLFGGEFNVESHHFDKVHPFGFSDANGFLGWTGDVSYERNWMVGFTFRGGYYFVDYFFPYLRIGIETGRDKLITHLRSSLSTIPTLILSEKTWVWRFLSGVGIEFPIYCTALTVRLEYQYHSKGRTIETDRIFTDGLVNPIANSNMQPETQTAIITIVRNFY